MKSLISRIAFALLVVSLASVSAFAKTRTETIRFIDDVKVNGTLVSKGVYDLKFDDKTNEVLILKAGKVVARATGTPEKRGSKSKKFEWRYRGSGDDLQLSGVTFRGADHDVNINSAAASR